jgi:hypothetical protein
MGAAVIDDREVSPNTLILCARAGLGPGLRKGVVVPLDNAAVDVDVDPIRRVDKRPPVGVVVVSGRPEESREVGEISAPVVVHPVERGVVGFGPSVSFLRSFVGVVLVLVLSFGKDSTETTVDWSTLDVNRCECGDERLGLLPGEAPSRSGTAGTAFCSSVGGGMSWEGEEVILTLEDFFFGFSDLGTVAIAMASL